MMDSSKMAEMHRLLGQLVRFGIVGLASNAVLYLAYLGLTAWGIGPKVAMTLLFFLGVLQTFVFNKHWSFSYAGEARASLRRYALTYASAYLINLAILLIMVDEAHWPHQLVQGLTTFILAAYLFVMQKLWVFRTPK